MSSSMECEEQLLLNLDHVDSLKVLGIYKRLADEIVELKDKSDKQLCMVAEALDIEYEGGTDDIIDEIKIVKHRYDELEELKETNKYLEEENKKLKKEAETNALLLKGSTNIRRECIKGYRTQIEELTERVTDLQNVSRTYKKELDLEHTRYVKSKEELYETIMELKNPVTNYDERCGVVRVRCNHAYLMAFMSRYDITDSPDNIDEQEEFDGVLEHMSKEVENVIDTYLQDTDAGHTSLNEIITEKLDNIIEEAISDGIIKAEDDVCWPKD